MAADSTGGTPMEDRTCQPRERLALAAIDGMLPSSIPHIGGADYTNGANASLVLSNGGHEATRPAEFVPNQVHPLLPLPPHPLGGLSKRVLDIAVAATALVLLLPLMLLIAVMVRASTGGGGLFKHPRVGYRGKVFNCYKFRTMRLDGDQLFRAQLASDARAAREWRETRKLHRDPRVTPLGRVLRRSSLDELPQLINVLRGEMSCVGPRPVVADELQRYGRHASEYLRARPGMTGSWQVSGRSSVDYRRRIELDLQYLKHWSLLTDIRILAKTAIVVFRFDDAC